jgi:FkbM family methyltransferase
MNNFIHVGGHDGNDHILACVEAYGWSGIVAEPIPRLFKEMAGRYSGHDVICENVAVSDVSGIMDLYTIDPAKYEGLPRPWPDYSSTLDQATHHWHVNNPNGNMHIEKCITMPVQVVTIQQLVDKHAITSLDLLSIDAEGCDGRIVKSVKSCSVRPSIIIFEHLMMHAAEYKELRKLAEEMGYNRAIGYVRDTMLVSDRADERFLKKLALKLDGWWWTTPAKGYDPIYIRYEEINR